MTPGTRESASSNPKPLTDRNSGAEILVTASGVVRMDEGDRVAAIVTGGSDWAESRCAESRAVGRCAIAAGVSSQGSSAQATREERMNREGDEWARDNPGKRPGPIGPHVATR